MDATAKTDYVTILIPPAISSDPEVQQLVETRYARAIQQVGGEYVLDMKDVKNLFSATIRLIVHLHKVATMMHAQLCLVNVHGNVRAAVETLKLSQVIPVYDTVLDYELEHLFAMPA